jgi:glycosyltransferase involved in cell wall biosynthesis
VTAALAPTGPDGDKATRVHLVYPHGDRISTPDAIGRELGRRLQTRYTVIYHDWSERDAIEPEPGDVLIGHPNQDPNTVFRRSVRLDGWRRRLLMAPFNHGDLRQVAFEDSIVPHCDLYLAITGPYWFTTITDSRCSHWQPKMIHLDLAVDRNHYPPLKTSFGAPGKRRVVYIGRKYRYKNTAYLSGIAAGVPGVEFAWIGVGDGPIEGFASLGEIDFGSKAGRDVIAGFDFMLTVGRADANPTTILEAMAWGLIPVCTPTSGYQGIPSIPNVPLGDAASAAANLRRLLSLDEPDLLAMQSANWRLLDEHYTWDRFATQVIAAIESSDSPPLLPESLSRRLAFTFYDHTSPYGRAGRLMSRLQRRWNRFRAARTAAAPIQGRQR